jgi:hypothetical protein
MMPLRRPRALPPRRGGLHPHNDAQVLERVPARASDPAARELQACARPGAPPPQDLAAALPLAERCFDEVGATGDPRYIGCSRPRCSPGGCCRPACGGARAARAGAAVRPPVRSPRWPTWTPCWRRTRQRPGLVLAHRHPDGARRLCRRPHQLRAPGRTGAAADRRACRAQVDAATGRAAGRRHAAPGCWPPHGQMPRSACGA